MALTPSADPADLLFRFLGATGQRPAPSKLRTLSSFDEIVKRMTIFSCPAPAVLA